MRARGRVDELPGAGPADHVCWVYDDDAEFDVAAQEFLAGGVARGERVLCVGDRVLDGLRTAAGPVPHLDELIARGTVETLSVAQVYEATGPFRPEDQLAYYDAATRRAVDAGYRGLRVIAEVSDLASDPVQRPALVRWEQLADDFAARGTGFSAMCAYRADLAPGTLADLASVHPLAHAAQEACPFVLHAEADRLVLAGSIDTFTSDRLARLLDSAPTPGDAVVLDLAALDFADAAACRVLARWAAGLAARSVTVQVAGASPLLRRTWRVLGLDGLVPLRFVEPT